MKTRRIRIWLSVVSYLVMILFVSPVCAQQSQSDMKAGSVDVALAGTMPRGAQATAASVSPSGIHKGTGEMKKGSSY